MLTILLSSLALIIAFYGLHRVTDHYFVHSLEQIAKRTNMTSDVAGATLMAMGSSAPELFTSLLALVKGTNLGDLGAGTIVGSAIFNILVIIGASALFRRAQLTWQPVIRDMVFYILTILLLYMVFRDGLITLLESVYLVLFYLVYLIALPLWRRILPYMDQLDGLEAADIDIDPTDKPWYLLWTLPVDGAMGLFMPDMVKRPEAYVRVFVLSIAVITGLSWVLVEAGVLLAEAAGMSYALIGLTVLAVGTSIPDLLASVIVARKGQGDMAVANAVGSNIFDILVGLGVVWMVIIAARGEPIPISRVNLGSSIILLLATVAALLFLLIVRRWAIGRRAGVVLIALYVAYLYVAFMGYL